LARFNRPANVGQCRTVRINGMPAHRLGDRVTACGGTGTLVDGSGNVNVGG